MPPELNSLGIQQRRMLEILWQRKGATVQEVLDAMNASSDTPLAYTTVLATMQKLEKTGWVTHTQSGEHGPPAPSGTDSSADRRKPVGRHGRAYIYTAVRSRNEAIGDSLRTFAETFLDGSKTLLFQHFLSDTDLSDEELDEIRKMIVKRRKGIGDRE